MAGHSRRSFLSAAGAIPFALWLESSSRTFAQSPKVFIRSEAYTPAGQAMLAKFSAGVELMKNNYGPANPGGWVFHWYTHGVRSDRTKASEIAYMLANGARKEDMDLAQETWDTCQAHHPGDVEDYFLPWHRMFVYFLERQIRYLSGDPGFALPYWNYSASGPNHGVIPPAFRNMYLLQTNRNPGVNAGQAIDISRPGDLSLEVLKKASYSPVGADSGFNSELDSGLHGNVHVDIGDTTNMGSIEWAAEDPIFWMHHCNIDRLWASWNRNGGLNPTNQPTWMNKQFVFQDVYGSRVVATVKDFVDIGALNYTYDNFEPKPPDFTPSSLPSGSTRIPRSPATPVAETVALGTVEVRVALRPGVSQPDHHLDKSLRNLAVGRKMYLVLDRLQANTQPGVIYDVYLNLPPGTAPGARAAYLAGSINFFGSAGHAGHAPDPDKFRSLDVTNLLRTQQAAGALADNPVLSVIPGGMPTASAEAIIGEVLLVEQ
jgi:tyrosinase